MFKKKQTVLIALLLAVITINVIILSTANFEIRPVIKTIDTYGTITYPLYPFFHRIPIPPFNRTGVIATK